MAAVASTTTGGLSERMGITRLDGWPENGTERFQDDKEKVGFLQDRFNVGTRVLGDGRIDIDIDPHKAHLAGLLKQIQHPDIRSDGRLHHTDHAERRIPNNEVKNFPLQLNIVIQVIGSRGDIQPFVALGRELKSHGHRVRLATHLAFREFVLQGGLEFFSIGGDPTELMAFMVKNPGLLPGLKTIRSGAILRRRREMKEIFNGCWKSCFKMGDGTDLHQIKEDPWSETLDYRQRPFVADVIIANPPSLAHIHCAQRLGIPLHVMFTMPWSPTQSFPHPLAIVHPRNYKPTVANFVSYGVVDIMVWQGLGDILNTLRKNTLALQPIDAITAPSLLHRLHVPHAYLWSPALLPKPPDWDDKIDVCGFGFLPAETSYTPPKELDAFLNAGPKPIYIGFGSIVVDDPVKLTKIVFGAVQKTGQRALVSKGWGNLGAGKVDVPENILIIGNCPHDWLFRHVSCVIHHGGAGTTAAGLSLGRPTIIIPFFGDQQFWGEIVARAGAGPSPIPHKQLTLQNLSDAIGKALEVTTFQRAQAIARNMQEESGVRHGVYSFYRHLDVQSLRCSVVPNRPAAWHLKHTKINLSAFAAAVLVESGKISPDHLVLHRPMEYDTFRDPAGPLTASAQVLLGAIANFVTGLADAPREIVLDIVSAARTMGQPHEHLDHQAACRAAISSLDRSPRENSFERQEIEFELDEHENDEGLRRESPQEGTTDEDSESHVNSIEKVSSIRRKRDLQLEKAKTMSSSMVPSKPPKFNIIHEAMFHGSKMSKKLLKCIIWLPTDVSLSMARGFHNAPKLYNDPMVNDIPQVIGLRSGFRAAGKVLTIVQALAWPSMLTFAQELRDGFYFGITGLGTQPRYGLKHDGVKGLFKGIGKAVGGVVLKPTAGLWGLVGYPLSGMLRDINDSLGKHQRCLIAVGRISQGLQEMRESSVPERAEVSRRWIEIEKDLKKSNKRYSRLYMKDYTHAV
ncbi:hypothetical protein BDV38DRAFT_67264 [Aspergillus pseudotamarii]|uniref:Uncharacterized protein n=1 Tax=Aspergillus pseudotamarii TaxID=132259 RepID=A0A5N6TAX5_ASPPS|nr:uncharacterized protein BDV38DRAFT_67264 [Aspergillus pseudotamarii]KAE8143446.1 hypothetical protein BDV38DRAFT_67264 [Aspergillus pseudotamarii]